MATAAELTVKIGADISAFQAGMGKLEGQLKNVGASLKNVGRQMSLAVTLPIAGVGAAAIKAASDVEEMESKFNTVFSTVGGKVRKDLDAFAKATGRSRFALAGMASELGDIIKPMGFTESQAGDMSTTLTKLAVDLGSFNNMPMDEALTRLRGALIGAHENVATFGVIINENTLKQELARMGMDKLTGSAKEQAKVQARMNLIMAQTTDAQGDAVDTAGSFANNLEGLKNALYDLGVTLGQVVLPHANKLVDRLREMVAYVQNLNPDIQRLGIIIAGVAAAAGPLVFALGGITSSFGSILRVLTLTMGLFNPWVAGIAAAAAIGVVLYRQWNAVPAVFEEIKRTAKLAFDILVTWWIDNRELIIGRIAALWEAIQGAFGAAFVALSEVIETGLAFVRGFWVGYGSEIVSILGFAFSTALNVATTYFKNMKAVIELGMALIKPGWDGEWAAFTAIVENNTNFAKTAVEDFMRAVDSETDLSDDPIDKKMRLEEFRASLTTKLGQGVQALKAFSKGADTELVSGDGSVANSALEAQGSIRDLHSEIGGFTFTTTQYSSFVTAIDSMKGSTDAAKESVGDLMDEIPTELVMPTWDVTAPTEDDIGFWGTYNAKIKEARDFFAGVSHHAGILAFNLTDVESGYSALFGDSPQWMKDLASYADAAWRVFRAFEALGELMQAEFWRGVYSDIRGLVSGIGSILGAGGSGSGVPDFTGGAGGIGTTGPGTTSTGAAAAGAGTAGTWASGSWAGLAATGYVFGRSLYQLFGGGQTQTPWDRAGITQAEWTQQQIDSGGYAHILGNLAGPNSGILGLLNGSTTPGWLSGLQGYTGSDTSGRMSNGQTVNVILDGRTIATATVPYLAGELEVRGTNY